MSAGHSIRYWSTRAVSPAMRVDYWMSVLQTSLWPVTEWTQLPNGFGVDLQESPLGCLSSMLEHISAHVAHRSRRDVERSEEPSYHLFANFKPWSFEHRGRRGSLASGDLVLMAEGEHTTYAPDGFNGVILKCPASWVLSWLPDPEVLVGRRIARESRWGRVLSPMVSQLTPALAAAPPLPQGVLVDQLGAMLTLVAGQTELDATTGLSGKILDSIRERCAEPELSAADLATTLNVSPRTVHRVLGAEQRTFASELLNARIGVALQLLSSRSTAQLTMAEIARRAGFMTAAHFARVIRRRTGHTPAEVRRHFQS